MLCWWNPMKAKISQIFPPARWFRLGLAQLLPSFLQPQEVLIGTQRQTSKSQPPLASHFGCCLWSWDVLGLYLTIIVMRPIMVTICNNNHHPPTLSSSKLFFVVNLFTWQWKHSAFLHNSTSKSYSTSSNFAALRGGLWLQEIKQPPSTSYSLNAVRRSSTLFFSQPKCFNQNECPNVI